MPTRLAFPDPFPRNHCVVLAFTHASNYLRPMNAPSTFALGFAALARREGRLSSSGRAPLIQTHANWWARESGAKIVERRQYKRVPKPYSLAKWRAVMKYDGNMKLVRSLMTLDRWTKKHTRGAFVVLVRGHAVAVIEGVAYGYYRPRSRVLGYFKLEVA